MRVVDRDVWTPRRYHAVASAADDSIAPENTQSVSQAWRLTDEGIEVRGEGGVRRTKGEPITLRRITNSYGDIIAEACRITSVPVQLVAGMIAAESLGNPDAERPEAHLGDVSIGLTQTLTATAYGLAARVPADMAELRLGAIESLDPLPMGGDIDAWRNVLQQPVYAIQLGALYFALANRDHGLQFDPVLCYAAYNAGSVRAGDTPWGMHYYRKELADGRVADAMDNFVGWYGDARAVYGAC